MKIPEPPELNIDPDLAQLGVDKLVAAAWCAGYRAALVKALYAIYGSHWRDAPLLYAFLIEHTDAEGPEQ